MRALRDHLIARISVFPQTIVEEAAIVWLEATTVVGSASHVRSIRRGPEDLLHLVVEIKGYRREDAKEKKSTMDDYWISGVSNLGTFGRWAFAELREVYEIESDFERKIREAFDAVIAVAGTSTRAA